MNKMSFILFEFITLLSLLVVPFQMRQSERVNSLMKYSIVIDPGHGGKDNGCNYGDVVEDEINLSIGKYLFEELINNGFIVYLTRDDDYDLAYDSSENRKNDDLKNRASIINEFKADILISLHVNYYQSDDVKGPMVYYRYNDEKSKELATSIQNNLNELSGLKKKVHSDDFYLFRKTLCLACLVECGFISNKEERNKLTSDIYQKMMSKQIANGLSDYLSN